MKFRILCAQYVLYFFYKLSLAAVLEVKVLSVLRDVDLAPDCLIMYLKSLINCLEFHTSEQLA